MDEIKDGVQDKRKELQKRIDKLCAMLNKSFLVPAPEKLYSGLVFEPDALFFDSHDTRITNIKKSKIDLNFTNSSFHFY